MSRPVIGFHDIETDTYSEREMNDIEFAEFQKEQKEIAKIELEAKAKAEAKVAILDKLGLTAEEAQLLLS